MADLQPLSPEILQQAIAQMQGQSAFGGQPQAQVPLAIPQVQTPVVQTPGVTQPITGNQAALDKYYTAQAGNLDAQSALATQQATDLAAGPSMLEYGQFGLQGLGALTNVAGYFDNKKTQKLQREGLRTNIANAKQTQANTQEFRGGTKSAFA